MVTSYNVRGLNDEAKLRHLVNYCFSQTNKDRDHFFLFQETFLTKANNIPYLWRGNFHLTPGYGNSSGCVSLLSSHISVVRSIDFGMTPFGLSKKWGSEDFVHCCEYLCPLPEQSRENRLLRRDF